MVSTGPAQPDWIELKIQRLASGCAATKQTCPSVIFLWHPTKFCPVHVIKIKRELNIDNFRKHSWCILIKLVKLNKTKDKIEMILMNGIRIEIVNYFQHNCAICVSISFSPIICLDAQFSFVQAIGIPYFDFSSFGLKQWCFEVDQTKIQIYVYDGVSYCCRIAENMFQGWLHQDMYIELNWVDFICLWTRE